MPSLLFRANDLVIFYRCSLFYMVATAKRTHTNETNSRQLNAGDQGEIIGNR